MKLLDQSAQTNWKFIAIVAFVAVFLAGGILMLIPQFEELLPSLSPSVISSPNGNDSNSQVLDTSEWQTYRNDEFGFEVRYPEKRFALVPVEIGVFPDFDTRHEGEKLVDRGLVTRFGKEECWYGEAGFAMVCNALPENGISFVVVDKDISYFVESGGAGGEGEGEISVAGRNGIRYAHGAEGYNIEYYYLPLEANRTVVITIQSTFNSEYGLRYHPKELVDQILSTFRFVE